MKIGELNKILDVSSEITYTESVTNVSGFPETNIIDNNTLKVWKVTQGTASLVIEWTTGFTADMIGLFNVALETNVTITTYSAYPATSIESKVVTAAQLTGFEYKNALFELTDTTTSIVAIKLEFTGGTPTFSTYAGYIWAGDLIDFDCSEKMQLSDNSADQVTTTRTNRPDVNREYNLQTYSVTLHKETAFLTLRGYMRTLLLSGYATERPFIIDENFLTAPDLLLGILDAPTIKYDIFNTGDSNYIAQTTLGIREVT